jgi:hypothetical protein
MGSRSDLWMATAPYGLSGTVTSAGGALFHLWQLGDVGRDPPRLIKGNLAVELHGKRSLVFDTDDLAQSEREVAFIGEGFPSCVCSDQYRAPA